MLIVLFILSIYYLKSINIQIFWAIVLFLFAVLILFVVGLMIFRFSRKFSSQLFGDDVDLKYIDLVFVGAILLAISQLSGPFVASTYPMIFGPDASDYRLELQSVYINISDNSTFSDLDISESTAGSDQHYDEADRKTPDNYTFYNKITAVNANRFIKYDKNIFLYASPSDRSGNMIIGLFNPVINVDENSILMIRFKDKPSPGIYRVKIRGNGEDGKIRDAEMAIRIPNAPGEEVVNDAIYFDFGDAVQGSGYFMTYRYIQLGGNESQGNESIHKGSGTIDNRMTLC